MQTAFDWITMLIFAGLVTRFLSQSAKPYDTGDSIWHYLVPSVGCAVANWLGNNGWTLPAVAMVAGTVWYSYQFLFVRSARPPGD